MAIDDPVKPEFGSWRSYSNFAERCRKDAAYAETEEGEAFLGTVLATCASRNMTISKGQILYRAQLDYVEQTYEGEDGEERFEIVAHGRKRMMPDASLVIAGRANPKGVAYLYLASTVETAVSETRPWFGAGVSVSQFEVNRTSKVVNLTEGHGRFGAEKLNFGQLLKEVVVDAKIKQEAVWTDIDSAFSWPVSRTQDANGYISTQILASAFRKHGYDGLVYRSNFDDPGYNIVLFNPADADICNGTPYTVKSIKVTAEETGNTWHLASAKKLK